MPLIKLSYRSIPIDITLGHFLISFPFSSKGSNYLPRILPISASIPTGISNESVEHNKYCTKHFTTNL